MWLKLRQKPFQPSLSAYSSKVCPEGFYQPEFSSVFLRASGGQNQREKSITGTEYSSQLDAVETVSLSHHSSITFCVYNNIFR